MRTRTSFRRVYGVISSRDLVPPAFSTDGKQPERKKDVGEEMVQEIGGDHVGKGVKLTFSAINDWISGGKPIETNGPHFDYQSWDCWFCRRGR